MKKTFFALFIFLPFLCFSQTETQVRSSIDTKIPTRGNRAEGLKAASVREVFNEVINYSKAKADSVKTYSTLKTDSLRNYVNIKLPFATPESFGAVGNGIADDTQAMRAAIAGALYLVADKNYKITDTLNLRPGQTLTGTGTIDLYFSTPKKGGINANSFCTINGLTINQRSTATGLGSGQDNVCILVGYFTFHIVTPTNVTISNCKLNMYSANPSNTIAVLGANNVLIENTKFRNYSTATSAGGCHWAMNTSTPSQGTIHPYNITYRNCEFTDYGSTDNTTTSGVLWIAASSNVLIEGGKIFGAGSSAIYLFAGDYGYYYATTEAKKRAFRNIVVTGVDATKLPKTGINVIGKAVLAPGTPVYDMDILITNSSFKNDTLLNTSNGVTLANVSGVTVSNTTLDSFYAGVYAQLGSRNSSVQNCKIYNSGKWGVYVHNDTSPPEDISVIGCTIENTGSGSATAGAGVEIGNARRPTIRNNTFGLQSGSDLATYGIRIATQANPIGAILENNFVRNLKAGGMGYSLGNMADTGLVYKMDGNRVNTGITFRGGSTAITIDRN